MRRPGYMLLPFLRLGAPRGGRRGRRRRRVRTSPLSPWGPVCRSPPFGPHARRWCGPPAAPVGHSHSQSQSQSQSIAVAVAVAVAVTVSQSQSQGNVVGTSALLAHKDDPSIKTQSDV
eukprot:2856638-Pyramimonas_sp.AAC.1